MYSVWQRSNKYGTGGWHPQPRIWYNLFWIKQVTKIECIIHVLELCIFFLLKEQCHFGKYGWYISQSKLNYLQHNPSFHNKSPLNTVICSNLSLNIAKKLAKEKWLHRCFNYLLEWPLDFKKSSTYNMSLYSAK